MVLGADYEVVEELRLRWKTLWRERIDDKVRAEGIAYADYPRLFVERGTVIFATRNFKPVNFKEILARHEIGDVDRLVPPSPHVGGWGKFIRTSITRESRYRRVEQTRQYLERKKKRQQLKKSGNGWLHYDFGILK